MTQTQQRGHRRVILQALGEHKGRITMDVEKESEYVLVLSRKNPSYPLLGISSMTFAKLPDSVLENAAGVRWRIVGETWDRPPESEPALVAEPEVTTAAAETPAPAPVRAPATVWCARCDMHHLTSDVCPQVKPTPTRAPSPVRQLNVTVTLPGGEYVTSFPIPENTMVELDASDDPAQYRRAVDYVMRRILVGYHSQVKARWWHERRMEGEPR